MPQLKRKVTDYFYNLYAELVKPQHFGPWPERTKTGNYCVRHFCRSLSGNCSSWMCLNGELASNNETTYKWKLESDLKEILAKFRVNVTLSQVSLRFRWHHNLVSCCFNFYNSLTTNMKELYVKTKEKSNNLSDFFGFWCLSHKTRAVSPFRVFLFRLMCTEILAGIQLHVRDARLLCSPGMNPSERSLEYSLLNLGEGHIVQLFPAPLPNEPTYGHGAPWTCLGDQSYLAWVVTAKRKRHWGRFRPNLLKQIKDKEANPRLPTTDIINN